MSVSASWQYAPDGEQRRSRIQRQRKASLALVPNTRPAAQEIVPADYVNAHALPRRGLRQPLEFALLGIGAIALHGAFAWWLAHLPASAAQPEPQRPPVEVIFTPPQIPPVVAQPTPPKPKPVSKPVPRPQLAPKPAPTTVSEDVVTVPTAPVAAAPTTAPVSDVVTEARADADYLQNPAPTYPVFAFRQGWEGVVLLNVLVLPDGTPGKIELDKSSGRKTLDEAAIAAVKGWRFAPAKRGTTPVEGWVSVPIEFKIAK